MAKVGVVLSGCGVQDGSEIHESVLALYFLEKSGATPVMMAPNIEQVHVVNHLTGQVSQGERRNVLVESARIARGNIKDVKNVKAEGLKNLVDVNNVMAQVMFVRLKEPLLAYFNKLVLALIAMVKVSSRRILVLLVVVKD